MTDNQDSARPLSEIQIWWRNLRGSSRVAIFQLFLSVTTIVLCFFPFIAPVSEKFGIRISGPSVFYQIYPNGYFAAVFFTISWFQVLLAIFQIAFIVRSGRPDLAYFAGYVQVVLSAIISFKVFEKEHLTNFGITTLLNPLSSPHYNPNFKDPLGFTWGFYLYMVVGISHLFAAIYFGGMEHDEELAGVARRRREKREREKAVAN